MHKHFGPLAFVFIQREYIHRVYDVLDQASSPIHRVGNDDEA